MSRKVYVIGVGMTNFTKPNPDFDYPAMGKEAVEMALTDAGIKYTDVQQAVCSYMLGDSTSGQRILYQVGMTGIPIHNTTHAMNGMFLSKQFIESNGADCMLAVAFEKMSLGPMTLKYGDRSPGISLHIQKMIDLIELSGAPGTAQVFGNAGVEYMKKYGATEMHLAKIAAKNFKHAVNNPRAQTRTAYTVKDILNSRRIHGPLTKLECSPTSDGASAAVLASEDFVIRHGLKNKAIEIIDMEMVTDTPEVFIENSLMKIAGYGMTELAAKRIYERTGISPKDLDIVELHDCFATNELITYEALQLCGEGEAGKFVDEGLNTYGGQVVVNPSGGLIARGHPLGATGLAQCAELVWQLRGEAGQRQVCFF